MVNIPNRLLKESFVEVLFHDTKITVLQKTLQQNIENRQSYVARHAISFVLQGKQRIETPDGNFTSVSAGQIAFFKRGIYTVSDLLSENAVFSSFHIFLEDRLLQKIFQQHRIRVLGVGKPIFTIPSSTYILHYIQSFQALSECLAVLSPEVVTAKIEELFAFLLAKDVAGTFSLALEKWQQKESNNLRTLMENHFDKAFSIEDYAYLTGRSVATFRREFKLKFGTSPRKWITQQRMEKAQELLQQNSWKVHQVANQVGYENASYFIQEYKKMYGYTPASGTKKQGLAIKS
ncbi:MAG: AraC family transcriptional regulator [Bacteroidota bacterium]